MTTTITPSVGAAPAFTQAGTGTTPGYSAIDVRRTALAHLREGPVSLDSYTVSQKAAGANMSVDIAASTGSGLIVQGDAITLQGRYYVPPHSAAINEVIATADAANPRIDSVIVEVLDDTHDATGSNLVRTRVVTGTAIAAVTNEAPGASPAALPSSAILLAYVQVDAGATSITTAKCKDMRPKRRGKCNIATSESTSATSYAITNLATPDRVTQVVLPTDGLIVIAYQAIWQNTVTTNGRASIFLNSTQVKLAVGDGAPGVNETSGPTELNDGGVLASGPTGLLTMSGVGAATEVTTGQAIHPGTGAGGVLHAFAAAGTYDVSVQFKNSAAGTLTASKRHLWVWTIDPDLGVLS